MTLSEIKQHLAHNNLRPLKQFGQNFLHDENLCEWLVNQATEGLVPPQRIIEIGPGLGALTEVLLQKGFAVLALEKDRGLADFLRQHHQKNSLFTLMEGDALEHIPPDDLPVPVVVGNLPYYISTALLMAWLHLPQAPEKMVFTLQKELVDRLSAPPHTKTYGALTVLVQADYEVQLLRSLPPTVFYPQPEVDSAVVQLVRRRQALVAGNQKHRFHQFVKQGFSQRRKKLTNLLPVKDGRRAEELSLEQWLELFHQTDK